MIGEGESLQAFFDGLIYDLLKEAGKGVSISPILLNDGAECFVSILYSINQSYAGMIFIDLSSIMRSSRWKSVIKYRLFYGIANIIKKVSNAIIQEKQIFVTP